METVKIKRTPYGKERRRKVLTVNSGELVTEQHHAIDCDTETIIRKYAEIGMPLPQHSRYGEAPSVDDVHEMREADARARSYFETLPDEVRARYGDVYGLMDAMSDPSLAPQLVEDGIFTKYEGQLHENTETPSEDVRDGPDPASIPADSERSDGGTK